MEYQLSLRDYINIVRRRILYLVAPLALLSALGIVLAAALPAVYASAGKILIESQQIPEELVRSTVTGVANERVQIIQQRVMTRDNLLTIIRKYDLYRSAGQQWSQSERVEEMRKRISVELIETGSARAKNTIAIDVGFEDGSPQTALNVTNELITLFLDENVRTRTARATETTDFLRDQAEDLRIELEALESQLTEYKRANRGALPEQLSLHQDMLQRAREDLRRVESEENGYREQLRFLSIELSAAKSTSSLASAAATPSAAQTPQQQLAAMRLELINLEARYSDQHPDVQSLRQRISALEASSGESAQSSLSADVVALQGSLRQAEARLSEMRRTYGPDHPNVSAAENLVALYQSDLDAALNAPPPVADAVDPSVARIEEQISVNEARIASLTGSRQSILARISDLERRVSQTPDVELGLTSLSRDLENTRTKYEELKAKELQAQLSQNLEEDKKAERFTLLEPAVQAENPVRPNRLLIAAAGVAVGFVVGAALIVLTEFMFGGVYSPSVLAQIVGSPPLVIIPQIETAEDIAGAFRRRVAAAAASIVLVLSLGATHFLFMPLGDLTMRAVDRLR